MDVLIGPIVDPNLPLHDASRPSPSPQDDEPDIFRIENEIRFSTLDVGKVPRQVTIIRRGGRLKKPIESAFTGRGECLNVIRDHRGH